MRAQKRKPENASENEKKQNGAAKAGKKRSRAPTVLLMIVFFAGLGLLLYPTVANRWNYMHQSRAIAAYSEAVEKLDEVDYSRALERANAYNEAILLRTDPYALTDGEREEYYSCLDVTGSGIIGYIQIDKIDVRLPVYHGTSNDVLQVAAGHIEWSSLPVGGENTHCVLSGHRGLPRARLFTNLDKLETGDTFVLRVLDEIYTYRIERVLTVLPNEADRLGIIEGEDLVTLVTCTPYGINTHRLLVTGRRIENEKEEPAVRVTNEASLVEPLIVATCIAAPVLTALFMLVMANDRRRARAAAKRGQEFGGKENGDPRTAEKKKRSKKTNKGE